MKKFQFRLQKVMEVKEEVEKQKMLDLAAAKKIVQDEKDWLEQLFKKDHDYRMEIEIMKREDQIDPTEINGYFKYLKKLERDIKIQYQKIHQSENEMERKRLILVESTKEKKVLEKLKERKLEDYQSQLSRKEQHFIDEIASRMCYPS